MNIRKLYHKISDPFFETYHRWFTNKPQVFRYKDLEVNVLEGVFSPLSSNTTLGLLNYIETVDLEQKTILELGCGTGIVSLICDSKNGIVTASDINEVALNELSVRAREENKTIIPVYSNLFENLHFHFDYIFINPPTIPENPTSVFERGYMCGNNFEFFNALFSQLRIRGMRDTMVVMVLPENAELFSITRKANHHHLKFKTLKVNIIKGERVVVYQVVLEE